MTTHLNEPLLRLLWIGITAVRMPLEGLQKLSIMNTALIAQTAHEFLVGYPNGVSIEILGLET